MIILLIRCVEVQAGMGGPLLFACNKVSFSCDESKIL